MSINNKIGIIYCRISKQKKTNYLNELSLDAQEQCCNNFCIQNNIFVKKIYKEIHSAYVNKKLPILDLLIDEIQQNEILIIYDVSRFSRRITNGIQRAQNIIDKGCYIFSIRENCGYSSSFDRLKFNEALNLAENESNNISDRIKNQINIRRKKGYFIGGRVPFGKNKVLRNNKFYLIDNEREKKIIDKIIDMRDNQKCTYKEIKMNLNLTLSASKIYYIYKKNKNAKRETQNIEPQNECIFFNDINNLQNRLNIMNINETQNTENINSSPQNNMCVIS